MESIMDYKPDIREKMRWILFEGGETVDEVIDQILALFKDWKSPEEVQELELDWEETLEIYKDPKRRRKLEKRKEGLMNKLKKGQP